MQHSLACDRGWRGVAPSVAVFQCIFFFFYFLFFPLGTSVREVNAAMYVMCDCFQNSKYGVGVRAVNISKATSFS